MKVPVRIFKMSGGAQYDVPAEGDLITWLKQEGDAVHKDDELCELETEKAVITIKAPLDGLLSDINYQVGKTWFRGSVIHESDGNIFYDPPFCFIETDMHIASPTSGVFVKTDEKSTYIKPKISAPVYRLMQKHGVTVEALLQAFPDISMWSASDVMSVVEARQQGVSIKREDNIVPSQLIDGNGTMQVNVPLLDLAQTPDLTTPSAVPLARRLAREHHIDLAQIQGSGPEGVILTVDVKKICSSQAKIPKSPLIEEFQKPVLLTMPRHWRTIAANMEAAARIPTADVRIDSSRFIIKRIIEWHKRNQNQRSFKWGLWFPFMVAYARALTKPDLILFNSYWHEESDETGKRSTYVAARSYVHMGIAYDRGETPFIDWEKRTISGERLRILTVHNSHMLSIQFLISEIDRLFTAAARKNFSLEDTTGYTAIFNNIGVLGHHSGRALLTAGIASEFVLGSVNIESGEVVAQLVIDHRIIDGAMTKLFFRTLYSILMQEVFPELEALFPEK